MTKTNSSEPRRLRWWEWQQLERQGCRAESWDRVLVTDLTDLSLIRNVVFSGDVSIGALGGERAEEGLENVRINGCRIGDHVWGLSDERGMLKAVSSDRPAFSKSWHNATA